MTVSNQTVSSLFGLSQFYDYIMSKPTFLVQYISGLKHFCSLYADSIYRLQCQSGPPVKLEGATLDKIQQQLEEQIPLNEIEDRRKWRDDKLAELYKLKHK